VSTVNNTNYQLDQSVRIFDEFYNYDALVPSAEYDLVYSFFKKEMPSDTVAANFAANLFRVADTTGVPVMDLLKSIQGSTGLQLTASLAYYLNNIRSNATLLGVNTATSPNLYAARAVIT